MKREAFNHTKMKRLCRRLDIPTWQAVGLLESLWNLTAKECPTGDIGRLSNEDIALGIDYSGDHDYLISSLVSSGWIDTVIVRDLSGTCPGLVWDLSPGVPRLSIHDWSEHADSHVNSWLAKRTLLFCDGSAPRIPHDAFNADTRKRIRAEYKKRWGIDPGEAWDSRPQRATDYENCPGLVRDLSGTCPELVPPIPEPVPVFLNTEVFETDGRDERAEPAHLNGNGHINGSVRPSVRKSAERIEEMRFALHQYMSMDGKRNIKPPDDPIVSRCLNAIGNAKVIDAAVFLRDRYVNHEQSPIHANGPRKYAWFVSVLAERFGAAS